MRNLLKHYNLIYLSAALVLAVFLWIFGYGFPVTLAGIGLAVFMKLSSEPLEGLEKEFNSRRETLIDNDRDVLEGLITILTLEREDYEKHRAEAAGNGYAEAAKTYIAAKRGQAIFIKIFIGIAIIAVTAMLISEMDTVTPAMAVFALSTTIVALVSASLSYREPIAEKKEEQPEADVDNFVIAKLPENPKGAAIEADGDNFIIAKLPENPKGAAIEAAAVTYFYDENPAVAGITLKIKAGERFGIIGRTNSGKTTLLDIIKRKISPNSGEVYIDGALSRHMTEELVSDIFGNRVAVFDNTKPHGDVSGKTVIISSTNTADVMDCSRIAVIDGGMIDAIGTHDTLLSNNILYRELFTAENPDAQIPPFGGEFSEILEKLE
jgi:ABC-type multidrug transport system fused ATPase/permease subunit